MSQQHPVTRAERTKELRVQTWLKWQDYYWQNVNVHLGPYYAYGIFIQNPNLNIDKYIFDRLNQPGLLSSYEQNSIIINITEIIYRYDISLDDLVTKYYQKLEAILPNPHDLFWGKLSNRKDLTPEFIEKYIDKPWNYAALSYLPNITIDFIKKHIDKLWLWSYIQDNPALDAYELMREFPEHITDSIYDNPTLLRNMEYVMANQDNFNYEFQANYKYVTLDIIESNPDLHWSWLSISRKPDLTIHFIKKYKAKLIWEEVTKHITAKQLIFNNPGLPWDYSALVYRADLTREELFKYITEYKDVYPFTKHPALKFKDYKNGTLIKWRHNTISASLFTAERDDFIIANYRQHLSAYRIQQHWHRIRCDPRHPVGQKKLEADYSSYAELCKPKPASLN